MIIGAGIAGCALAARLARAGMDVILFERDKFPRDKLCGEFLSGEFQGLLEELGCLDEILAHNPAPMERLRLTTMGGTHVELPLGAPGLGLSRSLLDTQLADYAQRCGARVIFEAQVTGMYQEPWGRTIVQVCREGVEPTLEVQAGLVVGAYGRRTSLDRILGRPSFDKRSPWLAFKRHHVAHFSPERSHLLEELRGVVELHSFKGGYCGVSLVESDVVNVCLLLHKDCLASLPTVSWDSIKHYIGTSNTELRRRLGSLEASRPMLSVAQISLAQKERHQSNVLFVGDAATMIAPLAGDGQAMALHSALMLAELIVGARFAVPSAAWDRQWERRFRTRLAVARGLHETLVRGWATALAVPTVKRFPWLGRMLIRLTRGKAKPRSTRAKVLEVASPGAAITT